MYMYTVEVGSDSHEMELECDRQPLCECNFKRRSWGDVIDLEGKAILSILELPSKVQLEYVGMGAIYVHVHVYVSLVPRPSKRKKAWYTLHAHARNFPGFP